MKKMLPLISYAIFCLAASAQPTSFGGITPGKTTRDELNNLVKYPDGIGTENEGTVYLKEPDGEYVSVVLHNDIVFKLVVLNFSPELKQALIEKYGQPRIKVGGIRAVTCRNNFGASSTKMEGAEERKWSAKDGVLGSFVRVAENCAESVREVYVLHHLVTYQKVEKAEREQARKEAEEKRRKLGNSY